MPFLSNMRDLWNGVGSGGRAGLVVGVALILAGVLGSASSLFRAEYGVLFSGLDAQDAASIVAELDRMKVPYRFGQDETTLYVRQDQVHATRLKLMGKGVALRGGVGFEIFNNTDFGMTEFAQKINYQRALQGELARTVMAFEEIQSARVHLVLPDSGLFKKADQQPKASISLALKRGRALRPEQVSGIQRLVAASVPEIREDAVTVLDQRGIALRRAADASGEEGAAAARFAIKHEIETYLARKVVAVLDGTFGPGKALVSVDVAVNHEQVSVTQEDVLPASGREGEATGVVVRRRMSLQGAPRPVTQGTGGANNVEWQEQEAAVGGSSTQEVEYQSGRRVEQIVSRPGSIRRISVGVMLPHALEETRVEEIRQVLAMTVGLNGARGDEIAISSVDRFAAIDHDVAVEAETTAPAAGASNTAESEALAQNASSEPGDGATPAPFVWTTTTAIAATLLVVIVIVVAALRQRRERERTRAAERERILRNLRQWLRPDTVAGEGERSI